MTLHIFCVPVNYVLPYKMEYLYFLPKTSQLKTTTTTKNTLRVFCFPSKDHRTQLLMSDHLQFGKILE